MMGILLLGATALRASSYHFTGAGGDKKKDAHKDTPLTFPFSNLRSASTLQLSLKTGLTPGLQFTGDFTVPSQFQSTPDAHSLMTYQKGNNIYIYPYKQSLLLTKFRTPERILH
jgi:hypothetical protein